MIAPALQAARSPDSTERTHPIAAVIVKPVIRARRRDASERLRETLQGLMAAQERAGQRSGR